MATAFSGPIAPFGKQRAVKLYPAFVVLFLALCLSACQILGGSGNLPARSSPSPTPTPRMVELPADHDSHESLTEWWYFTGFLSGSAGEELAFEFVVFKVERQGLPFLYSAHMTLASLSDETHYLEQRAEVGNYRASSAAEPLRLDVDGWQLSRAGDGFHISAAGDGIGLEIDLTPTKPAMLHGGQGWIDLSPAGLTYYYSMPRMAVTGSVFLEGAQSKVSGETWFDHQWGDFIVAAGFGWDWYWVSLGDGSDMMFYLLRGPGGSFVGGDGTFVDPEGRPSILTFGDIQTEEFGKWRSDATGIEYPAGWRVVVESLQLQLEIRPVFNAQEVDARETTGRVYWEGATMVTGRRQGLDVAGRGFVELTGYGAEQNGR